MSKFRGTVALLTVVLVTGLAAQPRGGGNRPGGPGGGTGGGAGGTGRPGNTAGGTGGSTAGSGHRGIGATQIYLRPGWGLAPASPFGNVANPGGVSQHPLPNFMQPNPIIQPLPTVIQPLGQYPYQPIAPQGHRSRARTVYVPVPVYYGTGYGLGYGYPAYEQPPTETVYVETGGPGTGNGPGVWGGSQAPVTVNNIYTVTSESKPVADAKPITLLVFKNHSIYAVSDYWVENGRVYYVTSYGSQDSASTDQLDLDFTRKLNDERGVKFELKPKS